MAVVDSLENLIEEKFDGAEVEIPINSIHVLLQVIISIFEHQYQSFIIMDDVMKSISKVSNNKNVINEVIERIKEMINKIV